MLVQNADNWTGEKAQTWQFNRVLYRKDKEKADPGFTITVPAGAIVADAGKGSLQILVTLKDKERKAVFSLTGAQVSASAPSRRTRLLGTVPDSS